MKLDFSCLKCGSSSYEVKNVVLPEKKEGIIGLEFGVYYFKVCLNCGFTEIYSAKIADKNEKVTFEY